MCSILSPVCLHPSWPYIVPSTADRRQQVRVPKGIYGLDGRSRGAPASRPPVDPWPRLCSGALMRSTCHNHARQPLEAMIHGIQRILEDRAGCWRGRGAVTIRAVAISRGQARRLRGGHDGRPKGTIWLSAVFGFR